MSRNCPHCGKDLHDQFDYVMDELNIISQQTNTAKFTIICPNCKEQLYFTMKDEWYCHILPDGTLDKIGRN